MTAWLWNPTPIIALTIRQFAGGRAVRVVAGIAFLPVVFAILYALNPSIDDPSHFFSEVIYRGVFAATLLPLAVLILATGALGNEIEDETLPFLLLKPIRRSRIVLEKFIATVLVDLPILVAGSVITYLVNYRGAAGESDNLTFLWAVLGSTVAGVAAYGSVFLLVSLLVSRALLAGIVYILLWESLLGRFLPGLRIVSIRHFTESIYVGLVDEAAYLRAIEFGEGLEDPTPLGSAVITVVVVTIIALALAAWRMQRLDLD
jgi:ABC-2 type transport system permease protein